MTEDEQTAKARAGVSRAFVLEQLKRKSHEKLLFLVEQLLQWKPDIKPLIELLIELPFSAASQQGKTPGKGNSLTLNLASIRKQIEAALRYADGGWAFANLIATELSRLNEIGDDFAEAGEWANAQAVYVAIAEQLLAEKTLGEGGDKADFDEETDDGLGCREDGDRVIQRDAAWEEATPVK